MTNEIPTVSTSLFKNPRMQIETWFSVVTRTLGDFIIGSFFLFSVLCLVSHSKFSHSVRHHLFISCSVYPRPTSPVVPESRPLESWCLSRHGRGTDPFPTGRLDYDGTDQSDGPRVKPIIFLDEWVNSIFRNLDPLSTRDRPPETIDKSPPYSLTFLPDDLNLTSPDPKRES